MLAEVKQYLMDSLGLPEEMLAEFVDSFMESFDLSAEELRPYADGAAPDWMDIRRITHMIKGYSEGVGAMDLRALSDRLNAAAHAEDASGCRTGAAAICDLHARYRAEG